MTNSKRDFFTDQPDAKPEAWLRFLNEVMEDDEERIELLQQWAGYCLTAQSSYQKFMLIAGEGANGKTVFTKIIEKMVGEENVSHIPLSLFSQQFSLYSTLGKSLNSTSESSHRLDELAETALKSFTSADAMTFQRKYKEPTHSKPTAKVMLSTNQLPNFADKSIGIWRRMLFVPFDITIEAERQNPRLVDELCCELPAIFNWAVEGLQKLKAAGRFIEPKSCIAATEQYRRDVNPARTFLLENFTTSLGFDSIVCKELYDSYVNWCFENGYRPMNASNLGKEVKRAFPNVEKTYSQNGGKRIWCYCGKSVFRNTVEPHIKAECSTCSSSSSNSYIVFENLARSKNIRTKTKTFRNLPAQIERLEEHTEPVRLGEILPMVLSNIKTRMASSKILLTGQFIADKR